jgi:lipopolysaccharide transport system permease protein
MWSFILPLVNLAIYFVIFGNLMGSRLPGSSTLYSYAVYLSVGLIPWTVFANGLARGSSVFLDKRHIISKIKVSLPSLLLYVNLSETITFVITSALFAVVLACLGFKPSPHFWALPFIYYLQVLLTFGLGLLCAVLTVFIRDLKEVVGVGLQVWFWFTPIVYVPDILPGYARSLMAFNPAYIIIESYQRIIVFHDAPAYRSLMVLTVVTHAVILLSYLVFRHLERDLRDFL